MSEIDRLKLIHDTLQGCLEIVGVGATIVAVMLWVFWKKTK